MSLPRRSAAWVAGVVVLVAAALVFLIVRPIDRLDEGSAAGEPLGTGLHAPTPAIKPASRGTGCVAGVPDRLVIPSLGVDAPFEEIGLDTSAPAATPESQRLGNPSDRTKAGWYAAGPRPGSGHGTVLTDGHTYRDGSAIFKDSFSSTVQVGQRVDIQQRGGGVCSYRIDRVWRNVDSATDYPRIVRTQHLYDLGGPERLFLTTCSGRFDTARQKYDQISIVIARPISR